MQIFLNFHLKTPLIPQSSFGKFLDPLPHSFMYSDGNETGKIDKFKHKIYAY